MKKLLDSIDPSTYSLSAIVIGYLLIDDLTPSEQNSVGNWLMLVGQVLCTNSAQQQVVNNGNSNQNSPGIINDFNIETIRNSINKINNNLNEL